VWKIWPPPGFDPRTVHPVATGYTDWAITASLRFVILWNSTTRSFFSIKSSIGSSTPNNITDEMKPCLARCQRFKWR
jgi:hypothetical protein